MKIELLNNFLGNATHPTIVTKDSKQVNTDNIFLVLNEITKNNWSYVIDSLDHNEDGSNIVIITLFAPGRVTQGIALCNDVQMATKEALVMAYNSLVSEKNGNENLLVGINNLENREITTIDAIEKEQAAIHNVTNDNKEENKDVNQQIIDESQLNDTDPVVKGSEVTEKQIFFMNKFKEHNKIKTDLQFDYYVKTWAENTGVDDIDTKSKLVYSNYQTIQNFIDWVKKIQPALDNGLASPIE